MVSNPCEPDKIVAAQGVLKLPIPAAALLAGEQVRVADLARAHPQVAHHGQQVEADLGGVVAGDAPLEDVHDLGGEVGGGDAGPVADGGRLEAVELVEGPVDGGVGDEVEGVGGLVVGVALGLVDEGGGFREAVVHVADQLAVGEGLAAVFRGEGHGELAKVGQGGTDVDGIVGRGGCGVGRLVEEHAEQGLGAAGILDGLRGEEEALRGVVVEGAVERLVAGAVGGVGGVLEEEDNAVDGVELGEGVRVEREELLELDVFYAEVIEQVGEDALGCSWSAIALSATALRRHVCCRRGVRRRLGLGCTYRIGLDCERVVSGLALRK